MKITESRLRRIIRQIIEEAAPPSYNNVYQGPDPFQDYTAQNLPSTSSKTSNEPQKYIETYDDEYPETDRGGMPLRGRTQINPEWVKWNQEQHKNAESERKESERLVKADQARRDMQDGFGDYDYDPAYQGQR